MAIAPNPKEAVLSAGPNAEPAEGGRKSGAGEDAASRGVSLRVGKSSWQRMRSRMDCQMRVSRRVEPSCRINTELGLCETCTVKCLKQELPGMQEFHQVSMCIMECKNNSFLRCDLGVWSIRVNPVATAFRER